MYPAARRHGKSPRSPNAIVTAGFRCAPETAPMKRMIAITISAGAVTAARPADLPVADRVDHPAAGADQHEQEGAQQLGEQPPPLQPRVVLRGAIGELEGEERVTPARPLPRRLVPG